MASLRSHPQTWQNLPLLLWWGNRLGPLNSGGGGSAKSKEGLNHDGIPYNCSGSHPVWWRGTGSLEPEGFGLRNRALSVGRGSRPACLQGSCSWSNIESMREPRDGGLPWCTHVWEMMRLHSRGEPCVSHHAPSVLVLLREKVAGSES